MIIMILCTTYQRAVQSERKMNLICSKSLRIENLDNKGRRNASFIPFVSNFQFSINIRRFILFIRCFNFSSISKAFR
jgi:hypothetical protein